MNLKDRITGIFNENTTLIQNFSYLSVLQVLNLLIPLLVYPYLISTLGSDVFGLVVFAQAIIGYFVILVSFGFNISGAKSISVFRDDREAVSRIFSCIFFIKLGLLCIVFLLLFVVGSFVPNIKEYKLLFILTLWMCLYDILFPIWYFQGIEKMKYITYITLTMKAFFLVAIFLLVKSPSDYLLIPIINGFGTIISGAFALYIILHKHKVKLYMPKYSHFKSEFKSSVPIFISNVSIQLYVATNKVIVGVFLGMTPVAYYDLAEKILAVLKTPLVILSQTIFPKISKEKNIFFVKKMFKISSIVNIIIFITAFFLIDFIVKILGKGQLEGAISVLKILLITVPLIGMSNIFGFQVLIPFGYNRLFSKVVVLSALFYFVCMLLIWTTYKFTIINVAWVTVITELFVTSLLFYMCKKNKLW